LKNQIQKYKKYHSFLCEISFDTIVEYLLLLKNCCENLQDFHKNAVVLSCAAVSDFFLPGKKMNEHKIQSRELKGLQIELDPTPKMLKPLKSEWCPDAFVIAFKLETDENILHSKVKDSFKKYKMEVVIGNLLSNYSKKIQIYDKEGVEEIENNENDTNIEEKMVKSLIKKHCHYIEN
jgi:phosphopantothenate---cysteine ligase (ATP)